MAELRVLQFHDPRRLIAAYCRLVGQQAGNQMPHGVSFSKMIDTIVDCEVASQELANQELANQARPDVSR